MSAPRHTALLLEDPHPDADATLQDGAVQVERLSGSPERAALHAAVGRADVLGIRSRTHVDAELLEAADHLLAVACFCIGTNQVDLAGAARRGVPVFNAPYGNTRSVAELTLASIVMLMRGVPRRMAALREGRWLKSVDGASEVRGKALGIVGYGNIGSQLSVLASGHGMHVSYRDLEPKLAHGNAQAVASLDELLETSDAVTLHVPSTSRTRGMIDARAIARMKPGAYLVNHARGDLVDIAALADALESGHLAGAAVDVFPDEPKAPGETFSSPLTAFDNVILTPHIGGSTVEAQSSIGRDAATKLVRYLREGTTTHAVNFPQVDAGPIRAGRRRVTCAHVNAPGFLTRLNDTVARAGANIASQQLETKGEVGYSVADVEGDLPDDFVERVQALGGAVRTRLLP